ncbi:hypothetical protein PMZ80_000976 [Knufia obscura]|uniref:Anaphase-promoting complex subunit 2 n=1 Tax=Knufia obscura TaxID=1635080 RepID=A0ABR0S1T6_9EURO|nr:hypothetical protein PMZ80_000976 [Knufia obscura]
MAAAVLASSSRQPSNAFSSVFLDSSSIRPPRNRQQFEADLSQATRQFQSQIEAESRAILGIANDQYAFPGKNLRHEFKVHFISCPPMNVVQKPTAQNRLSFVARVLRSSCTTQIGTWKARLGSDRLKKIFATVIDKCLTDFVEWAYSGTYNNEVQQHLNFWAEHMLSEYIGVFLRATREDAIDARRIPPSSSTDIEKYQQMALGRLWALRVNELFDMIVDWDQTVAGIDDLKALISTPQARQYVTEKFSRALQTRLLHPGASTIEILQVYISTIRAFRRLDPRGVLLSKVSGRVRQYLRERDDTIKVVVTGLLSDISTQPMKHVAETTDVLSELAWELQNRDSNAGRATSNLDWNNMDWQPDPIDAAPETTGTRGNKHTDVIGSVISLFESKDVFVKELQVTLAERLLRNKEDYDQETSVLEHLKIRFGDTALQACEVMLRDVLDSRRLDLTIRKDQGLDIAKTPAKGEEPSDEPELHAKILSRLFWPSLPGSVPTYGDEEEKHFKPPLHILHQREQYEAGFEQLKQTRKLTWNDHLGVVSLELTFADGRTYSDEVLPYQAGVIHAFNDDAHDQDHAIRRASRNDLAPQQPISKSVSELSEELGLTPALVRSACLLFVSKRVLTPTPGHPDSYSVLEYLHPTDAPVTAAADPKTHRHTAAVGPSGAAEDQLDDAAAAAAAAQAQSTRAAELAANQAAKEAEQREKRAKMVVYQQFITAMLTNQGAMPLPRIAMMLGMVVPGGFPYGNEELRDFLNSMVREGSIEVAGNNYKKAG